MSENLFGCYEQNKIDDDDADDDIYNFVPFRDRYTTHISRLTYFSSVFIAAYYTHRSRLDGLSVCRLPTAECWTERDWPYIDALTDHRIRRHRSRVGQMMTARVSRCLPGH